MRLHILLTGCALAAGMAAAEPYEVLLNCYPPGAEAYLMLIHPFNVPGQTNYGDSHNYHDCRPLLPHPDWGVKGWTGDDPQLNNNFTRGDREIKATCLNDPGDCWAAVVYTGSESATCVMHVVSWPGVDASSVTNYLQAGDEWWWVTNLPCAKDIGLEIIKARQVRKGEQKGKLKIKATFDEMALFDEISTFLRVSLDSHPKYQNWMDYSVRSQVKIKKLGTVGKFGRPVRATVKMNSNNRIVLRERATYMYQNCTLNVFIAFGGWSGFEAIPMDYRGKYRLGDKLE